MAAEHHSASSQLGDKKRQTMSKGELKRCLVANRLRMLQDDYIHPVSVEKPVQQKSENTDVIRAENDDKMLPLTDKSSVIVCANTKPVIMVDEVTSSEDIVGGTTASRGKLGSVGSQRQLMVVIDSEEDENFQCLALSTIGDSTKAIVVVDENSLLEDNVYGPAVIGDKSGRTTRKQVMNNNDTLELKASEKSRRRIIKNKESPETLSSAMKRAEEVRANLSGAYPSFAKLMLPSHVSRVFWLHLPSKFCNDHLPKCDSQVVLVDEAGKEFATKYLAHKSALSGGWRGFALDHGLCEDDAVVFQLIAATTFKVYIVRKNNLDDVDGALGLLNLDTFKGEDILVINTNEEAQNIVNVKDSPQVDNISPNDSAIDFGPEVLDGIYFSESELSFEALNGFKDFHIIVDGLVLDSKFTSAMRQRYYELCDSQSCFLHQHLLKGLNYNLLVGIISETTNIADAIKVCTSATSENDLRVWDSTLQGFELLGLKVDFLRVKLHKLISIALEFDNTNEYRTCLSERSRAYKRLRALEDKLTEFKDNIQY